MDFLDLQPVVGALYRMRFRLTKGLAGDMVLLQCYYLGGQFVQAQGVYGVPVPGGMGEGRVGVPGPAGLRGGPVGQERGAGAGEGSSRLICISYCI